MNELLFPEISIGVIFGKVLKTYRENKGFSQEELAFRAGIDRTYVSRLERGIKQPTISTLFKLAHGLGISAIDLIRLTETNFFDDLNR